MWLIEISSKFSESKIVDSYIIRAKNNEIINNALFNKSKELIFCLGHHTDLKFIMLSNFIEKNNLSKFNQSVLEQEMHKLNWISSETPKKKDSKKIPPNASQVLLKNFRFFSNI